MPQDWMWAAIVGFLGWVFLDQRQTIRNHLAHIQVSLDRLPCRESDNCPEGKE